MKMMKRIVSSVLAVAVILSCMCITAFAEGDGFSYEVSKIQKYNTATHQLEDASISEANAGDVIAVTISVKNGTETNVSVGSYKTTLKYSSDIFSYYYDEDDEDWDGDFYENGYLALSSLGLTCGTNTAGEVIFTGANASGQPVKKGTVQELGLVLLKVDSEAKSGETDFNFDDSNQLNAKDETPLTVNSSEKMTFTINGVTPTLNNVTLSGSLTTPTKGGTDASAFTGDNVDVKVSWSPALSGGQFAANTEYTATVTVSPVGDYVFAEDAAVTGDGLTFTKSGDTFVATKTFEKTADKGLVSISAAANETVYEHGDAADVSVTAIYDDGSNGPVTDFTVQYASGSALSKGDTAVTVSYGGETAEVSGLTVNAKALTPSADEIDAQTYTGSPIEPAVSVTAESVSLVKDTDYTVSYSNNVNAGTAQATISPVSSSNYTFTELNVPFTINKAAASLTTAPAAKTGLAYTGSAQDLITAGTAEGGTLQYKLDDGTYGTAIPTAVNAGEYTVYYKVVGDKNHKGIAEAPLTVSIAKAAPSPAPAAPEGLTAVYGQTLKDVTLPTGWSWKAPSTSVGNAGTNTFPAVYTPSDTNYKTVTKDVAVAVSKADQSPVISQPSAPILKGGQQLDLSALVSNAVGEVSFTLASGDAATINGTVLTSTDNPGEVKITVSAAGDSNYNAYTGTEAITVTVIDKTTVPMTVSQEGWTYQASETPEVSYGDSSLPAGGFASFQYTGTENSGAAYNSAEKPSAAGTYTVTVVYETDDAIYSGSAEFTIAKADPTGAPEYTKISESGKTLADAALVNGTLAPAGTVAWDDANTTEVTANASFGWTFTPDDTNNYNDLTGNITPWSKSTSNHRSSAPANAISEIAADGGKVTASPSKAAAGKVVTLTVTPDEGKQLESLTVTDKAGKVLPLTDKGNGVYTFVMPDSAVTVTPVFSDVAVTPPVPTETSYKDCPKDSTCVINPFADAQVDEWYHDGVHYCLENGLMIGTGDTTFSPNSTMTRAQLVTILWRAEGESVGAADAGFTDLEPGAYYVEAVNWAADKDIVNGVSDTSFDPDAAVTREQFAAVLARYAEFNGVGTTGAAELGDFSDGSAVSEYAVAPMKFCVSAGIIQGDKNQLMPQGSATRAQAATMLMRFLENVVQ